MIPGFIRRAKGDPRVASGAHQLAVWRHGLDVSDCSVDRHGDAVARLQRHHHSALPFHQGAYRTRSVIRCQHTIKSIGAATPLQMSEYYATSFFAGELFELISAISTNAAKARGVLRVALVLVNEFVTSLNRSLGGNYDAETGSSRIARPYSVSDGLHGEGNLRNENYVCTAGDAGMQSNPSRIAAHHFQDHDALMRLCRGVQSVKRIGAESNPRDEAKG